MVVEGAPWNGERMGSKIPSNPESESLTTGEGFQGTFEKHYYFSFLPPPHTSFFCPMIRSKNISHII